MKNETTPATLPRHDFWITCTGEIYWGLAMIHWSMPVYRTAPMPESTLDERVGRWNELNAKAHIKPVKAN